MPRSRISPSLINHNQGAGIKKKGLVSTIGYSGVLPSIISRRVYQFINTIIRNNRKYSNIFRGKYTSQVLTTENELYSWGLNYDGQYGNGTNNNSNKPVNTSILNTIKVSGGALFSASVFSDNKLYSWGNNELGELGNGTITNSNVPVAVDMTGVLLGKTISQISCGHNFTVVLASDNKLSSWGYGFAGQLGNNANTDSSVPVAVDMTGVLLGKTITQISCGDTFTAVLTSDNNVYSWGIGVDGQLGNNTNTNSNVPVAVDMTGVLLGKTITQISSGVSFCICLTTDNNLYSWGINGQGELGDGTLVSTTTPTTVDMGGVLIGKTISQISCAGSFSLVLTTDNELYSWGYNGNGQLGDGTNTIGSVPVAVVMSGVLLGKTITQISCYTYHSLVLTSEGDLYSWGWNVVGLLGDGTNTDSSVPVAVSPTS